MSIYFGGSRNLNSKLSIVGLVVQTVQASGQVVHVGCCIGADQAVIEAAVPSSLVVFAAFAQGGQGAWSGSAKQVVRQAGQAGAVVRYLAGGPVEIPLEARLIKRSKAALVGCSAAVFFEPGQGSLAVAAHAIQSMPVFAFGAQPQRIPGQAGQWAAVKLVGFECWKWQRAQAALF